METLSERILEELIYERVRLTVDLCELLAFEADLSASIERALRDCARSPEKRSKLAMDYLQQAWERVGDEIMEELCAQEKEEREMSFA